MTQWLLAVFLTTHLSVITGGLLKVEPMQGLHTTVSRFSEWSTWSKCSEQVCCRQGVTSRRRNCTKPPCTGIENESEDCPKRKCKECTSGPLAATTTAATGSFINSECETNRKHWASGPLSYLIHSSVFKKFPGLKRVLRTGFFGIQTLHLPVSHKSDKQMILYKFCFEPTVALTSSKARKIFHSNRKTKVSRRKSNAERQTVNGIVIPLLLNGKLFKPGIFWTAIDRDGVSAYYYYGKRPFKTA